MTVVRGDAARSLMARTRSARRQEQPSEDAPSWSQGVDVARAEQAGTSPPSDAAPRRPRLTDAPSAQRYDDVMTVMTGLVTDALAASGDATLRLSWTSSDGVQVVVTAQPAC